MSKYKILWIDDEIDFLKSHIIFLTEKGYEVDTSTNGNDALELIKKIQYDIILLDENMPGINGIQTLKLIKKINQNLKVIMITKSEEENIMEEAIGKEISDYLIKPVNPNQILLSLKKNLKEKELIKDNSVLEYQQDFRNLSLKMMDINNFEEWADLYKEIVNWEIKLSDINDSTMIEILMTQKSEANSLFAKFISNNYSRLINSLDGPTLSHHLIKNHLIKELDTESATMFIVIDNLRYDQWMVIEPLILDFYKKEKELSYYSILPTTTQYARNSLFSGLMPIDIKKRLSSVLER